MLANLSALQAVTCPSCSKPITLQLLNQLELNFYLSKIMTTIKPWYAKRGTGWNFWGLFLESCSIRFERQKKTVSMLLYYMLRLYYFKASWHSTWKGWTLGADAGRVYVPIQCFFCASSFRSHRVLWQTRAKTLKCLSDWLWRWFDDPIRNCDSGAETLSSALNQNKV